LLTQAAKMIMDDYPMMPLLQYTVPRLVKPYVGGYTDQQHGPLPRQRPVHHQALSRRLSDNGLPRCQRRQRSFLPACGQKRRAI
jgi:hypothetical protein